MKKNSGIYEIFNKKSGKKYIGSSVKCNRRIRKHLNSLKRGDHHNIHLQRAWKLYGKEGFVFRQIETVQKDKVVEREQEIFDEYLDKDKWDSLYNISKNAIRGPMYGRRGEDNPLYGRERPPEVKRKITESKLRNPHPLRGKTLHEDHPLTFRGHTHPDEWRKDMSERFSGEGNPMYGRTGEDAPMYGVTGEDHPRYGVSFTPEQKKKRSELFSGEGNSFYGKSHSEETKAILRSKTGERIALELV